MTSEFIYTPSTLPGTDEAAIINMLVTRTNSQRQDIRKRFKLMYGKVSSLSFLVGIQLEAWV